MKHTIPIIFAVTGHRDLVKSDLPKLEDSVRKILADFKNRFSHTQIVVISALAEGADMLVAGVAMELGIRLDVVLPYEESLYLNSFSDLGAKEQFEVLKAYATHIKILPCEKAKEGSVVCYERLGEYLAERADILIALWDGVDNGKRGGTSAVVKYMRYSFESSRFKQLEGKAIYIINTPRSSIQTAIESPYSVQKEYLGVFDENDFLQMCSKLDKLNENTTNITHENDIIDSFWNYFSQKAKKSQRWYKRVMIAILMFSFVGVFCMEIVDTIQADSFMWGYALSVFMAFALYYLFIKKGGVKTNHIHSRGIVEALRVQKAWHHAGLKEDVSLYYLSDYHPKYTWIRTFLKNLNYLQQQQYATKDINYVKEEWVKGQINYMKDAIKFREANLKKYETYEKRLYLAGFIVLVIEFVWFLLEDFAIIPYKTPFDWHYLIIVSALLFTAAAFLGEKFLKVEAYEEDIQNFKIIQPIYEQAQRSLDKKPDDEKIKKIIKELGIKALHENSKWIVLHDRRDVELNF